MEELSIRVATRQDLPAILQLYRQPDMNNGRVLSLRDAEKVFERTKTYPDYRIYVACRDGEILGSFTLLIMDNLVQMGARSGIVEGLVVASKWQGKGIGKQMMEFAMQKCREAGCYKLVLSSNKKREKAHQFYQSLGFEQHGYSFVVTI